MFLRELVTLWPKCGDVDSAVMTGMPRAHAHINSLPPKRPHDGLCYTLCRPNRRLILNYTDVLGARRSVPVQVDAAGRTAETASADCPRRLGFVVKLARPGFGLAAELPATSPEERRQGGGRSRRGPSNVIRGNRRAAQASARGTGRAAYTRTLARPGAHVKPTLNARSYDFPGANLNRWPLAVTQPQNAKALMVP